MKKIFFLSCSWFMGSIICAILALTSCGTTSDKGEVESCVDSSEVHTWSHPPFVNGLVIPNTDFYRTFPNDIYIEPIDDDLPKLVRYSDFPKVIIITDSGFILPNNEKNCLYHYDFSGKVTKKTDFTKHKDSHGSCIEFMYTSGSRLFMAFSRGNIFELGKTKPLLTNYQAPFRFSVNENNILYVARNITPPPLNDKLGHFKGGVTYINTIPFGFPNDSYLLNDSISVMGEVLKHNGGIRIFIGNDKFIVRDSVLPLNFDHEYYSLRIIFAKDNNAHMILSTLESAYHINLDLFNMTFRWKRLESHFDNPDKDLLLWWQSSSNSIIRNQIIYAYHSGYLYSLYTTKTYFKLFREKL